MSAVEPGQMSAYETGQMPAVPESSGSAWACGVVSGAPRRGLTRGEESEEGGDSVCYSQDGQRIPSLFDVFRVSKNRCKNDTPKVIKMVSKRDPKSEPKSLKLVPKAIPKKSSKKASKNDHVQHP